MVKLIRKHNKTIKRQINLQKQRGKGLCSSKPPRNNSIQMNNLSKKEEEGVKLYGQILETIETSNSILSNIEKSKNPSAELNKVKNLVRLIMKLKEIDVIKADKEKYKTIIIELVSINRKIKVLIASNASNV